MVNGKQKGCKKILVLYTNFGKNRKLEKTNWVMHQYHLGQHEEEKEGELVVGIGEASTAREVVQASGSCEEVHERQRAQHQQHHKLGGRSASGLEELIMGCTSTEIKEESSITNAQEAEWLKYSYWPDPDNRIIMGRRG
ncbi:hypothetical protein JHK82_043346 [Glycine max]|nr:hypothetical protein JHK82_043346 [Glycine max]